jgi:hypothetical protein
MSCNHVDLGDGVTAIVCSRTKQKRCYVCGAPAPVLCDYPVTTNKSGTCDRPCCRCHCERKRNTTDTDYCLAHAEHARKIADDQQRLKAGE